MAKKKVVYQITRKEYRLIEVDTEEQAELIKELNRDFERTDKQSKVNLSRYVSLDYLYESEGYELRDETPGAEERYIEQSEKQEIKNLVWQAMEHLTPRQKEMVVMIYFEEKSQVEVAKKYGISEAAVSQAMDRIHKTLRRILEKK